MDRLMIEELANGYCHWINQAAHNPKGLLSIGLVVLVLVVPAVVYYYIRNSPALFVPACIGVLLALVALWC